MGYADPPERTARWRRFLADYRDKTELNRRSSTTCCTTHSATTRRPQAEVDLVLDPDPPAERIVEVLGKYRFRDVKQAYRNLMSLARGEDPLPFDAALPAFSGGHRPAVAGGHRRHAPIPIRRW